MATSKPLENVKKTANKKVNFYLLICIKCGEMCLRDAKGLVIGSLTRIFFVIALFVEFFNRSLVVIYI